MLGTATSEIATLRTGGDRSELGRSARNHRRTTSVTARAAAWRRVVRRERFHSGTAPEKTSATVTTDRGTDEDQNDRHN